MFLPDSVKLKFELYVKKIFSVAFFVNLKPVKKNKKN